MDQRTSFMDIGNSSSYFYFIIKKELQYISEDLLTGTPIIIKINTFALEKWFHSKRIKKNLINNRSRCFQKKQINYFKR